MNNESTQSEQSRRTRRNAAIGVTAGLLGGGAIGLLIGVPSLTSAASDDTGSVAAAVVAVADDGVADTIDGTAIETERPDPGVQLRALLQQLVDDDVIDDAQADAVTQLLIENRPERGERGEHGPGRFERGPGRDGEVIAGLLGIDVETLRSELRAGNSLAAIAEANEVDPQTVIDSLVAEASDHVDLMVESERLTAEEAAAIKANLTERITARVNGEHPGRG
jgi:hypothetical protein